MFVFFFRLSDVKWVLGRDREEVKKNGPSPLGPVNVAGDSDREALTIRLQSVSAKEGGTLTPEEVSYCFVFCSFLEVGNYHTFQPVSTLEKQKCTNYTFEKRRVKIYTLQMSIFRVPITKV